MPKSAPISRRVSRFGKTGLEFDHADGGQGFARFVDSVLRGVGQVIFVNNSYTGLLCLIAIFLNAPLQSAFAFLGAAAGTGVALLLRADREDVRHGLYGYNACLCTLAVPLFLGANPTVWGLSLLAAGLSSALLIFVRRLTSFSLPALTLPFVLCTWGVVMLVRAISPGEPSGPPLGSLRNVPVEPPGILADWMVVEGALSGIAQVFFQPSPLSGPVVALAMLVGSRPVFLVACLAGLTSAAVASMMDVPGEAIRTGLFGFNAILVALALGVIYLRPGVVSLGIAIAIAALMPVFQMVCSFILVKVGLPTMTVPFITATWLAVSALRSVKWLRRLA